MAERIFPLDSGETAWSSTLQQAWEVTQTETASGRRRAICSQLYPKLSFTVSFTALDDKNLSLLMGFYAKCKGTLLPFFTRIMALASNYRILAEMTTVNISCLLKMAAMSCLAKRPTMYGFMLMITRL